MKDLGSDVIEAMLACFIIAVACFAIIAGHEAGLF